MSLRWQKPTATNVYRILKNPAYAGAYVYGFKHWQRIRRGGEPRPEHCIVGQFVENWNHHEGYISREEYSENERIFELNSKRPRQSQLGPGPALLQGRCFCLHHGAMIVHYYRNRRDVGWSFRCPGEYLKGGTACIYVPGVALEGAVVEAMLRRLTVPVIEEARGLWRSAHGDWTRGKTGLQRELDRRGERLESLKGKILEADRSHLHLRAMLEEEYEKVAAEVESLRRRVAHEEAPEDPFTEARWETLEQLCRDVRCIWDAATTTDQDRKQLIRLTIDRVVIHAAERERIEAVVDWADGQPGARIELLQTPHYHRLIWEWHSKGATAREIVGRLAGMDARTRVGRAWCLETVQRTLSNLRKTDGPARSRRRPSAS